MAEGGKPPPPALLPPIGSDNTDLLNKISALEKEVKALRKPQYGRQYGSQPNGLKYTFHWMLTKLESGLQAASTHLCVAMEFKEINFIVTEAKWKDKKSREQDERTIIGRVLRNACAGINARCNMTICLGVLDNGTIQGIEIESLSLVSGQ